jgi:hypothetical protein
VRDADAAKVELQFASIDCPPATSNLEMRIGVI